jgi:hypothetical protein
LTGSDPRRVLVYFLDDSFWESAHPYDSVADVLGWIERDKDPPFIRTYRPLRDFVDMYHMLQTEKPVYAEWEMFTETGEYEALASFELRTVEEAVGEGLVDTSAVVAPPAPTDWARTFRIPGGP